MKHCTGGLSSDILKANAHEQFEDGHCLIGDTGVRADLLEYSMEQD